MRRGVFLKLLLAFLVVIVCTTVTIDFTVRRAWENSLRNEIQRAMIEKTRLFAERVKGDHARPLQQLVNEEAAAGNVRATVIDNTGRVLADSQADAETMENHSTRPEFISALHGNVGVSERWSHTIGVPFLYVAAPVRGGAVRMAYPLSSVQQTTARVRRSLLIASGAALFAALLLAAIISHLVTRRLRRIVEFAERVAAGDLSARIHETSSDELATVAAALDRTAVHMQKSFVEIETNRQQLESLLHSMQEAVIAVDSAGRTLWANESMQHLLRGAVRVGQPLVEVVRDPSVLAAVETAGKRNQRFSTRATTLLPGRVFQVTAAPMPPKGAVAVLHDLTTMERTEKTRRDFIANVSHELRTPLTSVQGYAETLLESDLPQDARGFVEIIARNAARMARLTEDLLVLARVESGEQRFDVHPVSARTLLASAIDTFAALARESGIDLEIETSVETEVAADPDAIEQVLANLIRNAMNYGAAGKRIVIGTRDVGNNVEFYVRDFGAGIASEHLPRLFERFYRVDRARSRETGGTGLGLAIVKHIVRAHGGEVRVDSSLGHGATFCFTLPIAAAMQFPATGANS